jgi:hypothetical protein
MLHVVAIALTDLEGGAIAGVEDGLASVGDEYDRAAQLDAPSTRPRSSILRRER